MSVTPHPRLLYNGDMSKCVNPNCTSGKKIKGLGLCENCLRRYRRGTLTIEQHLLRPRLTHNYPERKAKYVRIDSHGCWQWTGPLDRHGYGYTAVNVDGARRNTGAHRYVYENEVGPVPEGLDLDHLCRVITCVNPSHLEPVTRSENLIRGARARTECRNGHDLTVEGAFYPGTGRCYACLRRGWAKTEARRKEERKLARQQREATAS